MAYGGTPHTQQDVLLLKFQTGYHSVKEEGGGLGGGGGGGGKTEDKECKCVYIDL